MTRLFQGSLVLFILIPTLLLAQIKLVPNGGFEDWSNGAPSGWSGIYIEQSTDAFEGSYAASVFVPPTDSFPSFLNRGTATSPGFTITADWSLLIGNYQFSSVGGDRLGVNIFLFSGSTTIASTFAFLPAAADYSPLLVEINNSSGLIPDGCSLTFQIWGPPGNENKPSPGTNCQIDNLSLEMGATDIEQDPHSTANSYSLQQNYPNPFNPSTVIGYTLKANSEVLMEVYDLSGRKIRTLINGRRNIGDGEVVWDGRNDFGEEVASGTYFYQLRINAETAVTRKMLLAR